MDSNVVICPHCHCQIIIQEVNCQIFRHGIYKSSGDQINPHASKEECDELSIKGLIYGCGKPFRIDLVQDKWIATICDYI